jgi:hypothetical protein
MITASFWQSRCLDEDGYRDGVERRSGMNKVVVGVFLGLLPSVATPLLGPNTGDGRAAASRVVRLADGDAASVPTLMWTCLVANAPQSASQPALLCTSDRKPIRSIWVSKSRIFVDTGSAPSSSGKGYVFRY